MDLWTQLVDRILMDAEDRGLLYRGIRIAPSEVAAFRTEAEHISTQLRDCYPNCNPAKQQEMATCQRAIGEVLIQLAEANHDTELDASNCGSVSSGLSGRSTPLDQYLRSSTTWENPQAHVPAPPTAAGSGPGCPSEDQQAYGGARPHDPSGGRDNSHPQMTISARDSLPWDTSMPLATTASLAAVIIAATRYEPIVVITGEGAVTVAAAVTAVIIAMDMTTHTPPPLLLSSLRDRMFCSFLA